MVVVCNVIVWGIGILKFVLVFEVYGFNVFFVFFEIKMCSCVFFCIMFYNFWILDLEILVV